jgi:hypothetical protein
MLSEALRLQQVGTYVLATIAASLKPAVHAPVGQPAVQRDGIPQPGAECV